MARAGSIDPTQHLARRPHLSLFWRHFIEMFAVMVAGMIVAAGIFLTIVGMTWDEATLKHPLASLLVIAAGMGVKNSAEMSAAMLVPVVPFLCLVWFDVTKSAQCGGYCILAIVAMVGLMLHRRSEYSMEMVRS